MDSATLERIVQWEEASKKNKKPTASPEYLPVRAKKDIMLRDVKAALTVDKREYLETQKSRLSSKSKSEEITELPTTRAPSGTTHAPAQPRKAYYEAWDKFDVDQALDDVNDAPSKAPAKAKPAAKDTPTPKSIPQKLSKMTYNATEIAPNPTAANIEKEKGNDFFKKGQFAAAVEHYSASITLDPTNAVLPINRAMALLKLERFSEAEHDCTLGLKLDSTNVKALWRRGIARRSLGRTEEAKKDFEQALLLDPSNKAVKDELSKLQSISSSMKAPVTKTDIKKPVTPTIPAKPVTSKKPTPKEDLVVVSKSSVKVSPSSASVISSKRILIKEVDGTEDSELFPPVAKKPAIPTSPLTAPPPLVSAPLALAAESLPVQPTPLLATPPSSETAPSTPIPKVDMVAPSTTLDFQRDWKSYSKNPQLLYQYFKLIAPESLPGLFKSAFESDYLSSMLQVFKEYFTKSEEPQALYLMLLNLAKVQRFDMTLMFMSGTDKQDLIAVFQHLNVQVKNQTSYSEQDLVTLASKFKTKY
ncbi:RNA polymerase II-associated protein 3 [Podila epicladia]|nr:RNA polymerase II-associated protein 3 [Podila epicladia]KAG0095504.1 RNA polymerase II-associated protein 3 [Podila epicladia]